VSLLEASLAQPLQSLSGIDLYSGLNAKAAVLQFSLIQNQRFVDVKKRIGHAAMGRSLVLDEIELTTAIDA
jgi:prophage maintenance system killer protein